ncbi:alpha-L-rhamnosidase C-terminal domain-containing protein [Microbacterium gorillae]|uniref:alpha-L-rhamnosidase C-terminal domain-containing protein n=1 Tax=Microbacterium gorillae TaxID=1231063 RepID=UPI00227F83D4|nr:alpha-L-rhamnosidase C-terminal domain-containing protein [Microbacterium gorillae]
MAGLAPLEAGYRRIRVAPVIGGGLTSASVRIETPFGPAASAWTLSGESVRLTVTVPAGTEADVDLEGETHTFGPGVHEVTAPLRAR